MLGLRKEAKKSKKQTALKTTLPAETEARLENLKTASDLVKMFPAGNISFSVADNLHVLNYFSRNIRGGAAIQRSDALNHYLIDIFTVEKDRLKNFVKNSALQIFIDETLDKEGRYVCSIFFAVNPALCLRQIPILATTNFEPESLNHSKVAQQILSTCNDFDIKFENICAYTTDNASYMRSAWNNSEILRISGI